MVVVVGMAVQKQERLMRRHPNIIIGTPGRLWELFSSNDAYMDSLRRIKFLVLDEADRMLEKGHFKELKNISKIVNENNSDTDSSVERQTFVFSATLSKDLRFHKSKLSAHKNKKGQPESGSMEDLLSEVQFRDEDPFLADVTTKETVSKTLTELRVDCLAEEKSS